MNYSVCGKPENRRPDSWVKITHFQRHGYSSPLELFLFNDVTLNFQRSNFADTVHAPTALHTI